MYSKLKQATLSTLLAATVLAPVAEAGVVIAAKDSPLAAMDAEQVKRVFLGHDANIGGVNLVVLYQADGETRKAFESKVLGKTGADLTTYWSKLIFTGKATAPTEVDGDAAVKAKLASTPGAVGYVSDGAAGGSVKVLFKY